jgi:hypothetical protein
MSAINADAVRCTYVSDAIDTKWPDVGDPGGSER